MGETDDITHLQAFLEPGAGVTLCEITPVSDGPVPPTNQPVLALSPSHRRKVISRVGVKT